MKNLSVFQVTLLAVFAALAVSGVLIFALVLGAGSGNSIGPIVIWGTLDQAPITVALRQAIEDDSRLSQVSYVQRDPATYSTDITNALANGEGPDVFLLRQDAVVRDAGKVGVVPYEFLPEEEFRKTFVEAASPYLVSAGVLAFPVLVDPMVMYWNRDLLASAGYAEPPAHWDEVTDLATKVVKLDSSGSIKKSGVAFGEYQNVEHAKDILSILILQAGGSITQKDGSGRLVPSLALRVAGPQQAAESALRFYTEFADPSKVHYSWNRALPNSRAAFAAGDLALYFGYASEARPLARTNPNLSFSMAPIPQLRKDAASDSPDITVARVYALATARNTRNPQGAITVASIIASKRLSRAISLALGIPSARRDVLSEAAAASPSQNPVLGSGRCAGQQVDACSVNIARSWTDPDPDRTNTIFRAMIESVTTGSARLTEAISRANQEIAQILGQ